MGTSNLSTTLPETTHLLPSTEGDSLEIEVGQGEQWYLIHQTHTSTDHYVFHLRYPESRLILRGLIDTNNQESPVLTTEVIHHVGHTQADTLIRTLAKDTSKPRYEGRIRIEPHAQECESYLNHHSLILNPQASSWTLPSLEIKADQVKCSHAATVRTITEKDLFYFRSRGITPDTARKTLIDAFIADIPSAAMPI